MEKPFFKVDFYLTLNEYVNVYIIVQIFLLKNAKSGNSRLFIQIEFQMGTHKIYTVCEYIFKIGSFF